MPLAPVPKNLSSIAWNNVRLTLALRLLYAPQVTEGGSILIPANMVSLTEEDIVKVMQSFQGQKNEVLIWQKDDFGQKRNVQQARIIGVSKESGEIILSSQEEFTGAPENHLYVFHNGRQIVFKTLILDLKAGLIVVEFPQSLILPNSRSEDRMSYLEQKIFLHFSHRKDVKPTDLEDLHKVQVVDVSENGISFKGSHEKNFGLQRGDRIWVRLDSDDELSEAVVKHLTPVRSGSHGNFLQIGLRFQQSPN